MAKVKKAWFCSACGNESPKWMGRCPACGEWNTMVEEVVAKETSTASAAPSRGRGLLVGNSPKPQELTEISLGDEERILIGNPEVERLLGGGIVKGSLILIGGEPGIGKSTLSLQIPLQRPSLHTLYVSGEESTRQIRLRAERLARGILQNREKKHRPDSGSRTSAQGSSSPEHKGDILAEFDNCKILAETQLENILQKAREDQPELLVIDSIQTIYSENIESSPGSVSQVRECAVALLRYAKETNVPVIIIGHITKDGTIAGPKVLEHIVDVVLQFEGDTRHSYRILRGIKNRFGSTAELAIFEMLGSGLREVSNPSEMFTPMHEEGLSGIALSAMLDGSRPFLIEIQSLVSTAAYGVPQRSATGFDSKRLNMLLAVLEKRAGFKLAAKDVFLNIAGGLKVNDPACDLAVVCAILSSNFDLCIPSTTCFAGEVGLSGEIRPVGQIERRILEAARLGYHQIYISRYNLPEGYKNADLQIIEVGDITELCRKLFK